MNIQLTLLTLLLPATATATAQLRGAASAAGTYSGSVSAFGETVTASLTVTASTFDIAIDATGAAPVTVNCQGEPYTLSGTTIDVTNIGSSSDCLNKALDDNNLTFGGVTFDGNNHIDITVKYRGLIPIKITTTKGSAIQTQVELIHRTSALSATPAEDLGTYAGSVAAFGETVKATLTVAAATFDIAISASGAAPVTVNCQNEPYTLSGSTIDVTNIGSSSDCLNKALDDNNLTFGGVTLDGDTIKITVKYRGLIPITITTTKGSAMHTQLDLVHTVVGFAPAAAGACSNAADTAALKTASFAADMTACGQKCWGAKDCVTACMRTKEGLSAGCAACFGAEQQCSRDHCMAKCAFSPTSDACKQCAIQNCQGAQVQCSGWTPPQA